MKQVSKVKLDKLYIKPTNLNLTQVHVMVLSYTDCIGSISYKKPLSKKRAHDVISYLISKCIQANEISSQCQAEENPVTVSTCNNLQHSQALINCLA